MMIILAFSQRLLCTRNCAKCLIRIGLGKKFVWGFCYILWKNSNALFSQPNISPSAKPYGVGVVSVSRCPITNYHKLGGLRQHPFIIFHRSQIWAWHVCVFCSGSYKPEIEVMAGLCSFLEAVGKNPLPSSFRLLVEFSL